MENMIFEHVDFLLPRHNCVIVPGLGAFIVNFEPSYCYKSNEITPPVYTIIFNSELKHNDGLIASSLQTLKHITYSAANNLVVESVKEIKQTLQQGSPITCGKFGFLKSDSEGNIVFYPNNTILYPTTFGLTSVSLQLLASVQEADQTERKKNIVVKRIVSAAAIVAGLFLFVTPSVHIGSSGDNLQKANFLDLFSQTVIESGNTSSKINVSATDIPAPIQEAQINSTTEKPARTYYIIIGGEENENQANRLLTRFQEQGFPKASIVKSDRYRVYVASFFDKNEAERYLDIFRLENPQYVTAWLYSKKNIY